MLFVSLYCEFITVGVSLDIYISRWFDIKDNVEASDGVAKASLLQQDQLDGSLMKLSITYNHPQELPIR